MDSNVRLGPNQYALGPVNIKARIPIPGSGGVPIVVG
jgi:hypothetical protein